MIQLPHNCHCGELSVSPKNWKQVTASLKKDWFISYRFYDPLFKDTHPNGKLRVVKGMNSYHKLDTRRKATKNILETEMSMLLHDGFNPILNICKPPDILPDYVIEPSTPVLIALKFAFERVDVVGGTRTDMRSMLKYVSLATKKLQLDTVEISKLQRKHIKLILEQVKVIRKVFSNSRFNKYRTYLMILLEELTELDAIDTNPVTGIRKKKETIALKDLLTDRQRTAVNAHLFSNYRNFWQFLHIFFHSGSRIIELCRVKVKDVDIPNQRCKYLVKKGKESVEVWRPIKNSVVQLWSEQIKNAKTNDYIFSVGLKPGADLISSSQIGRRWKRLVKNNKTLGVTADFYSLKHLNTDETAALLDINDAAAQNSHKSTVVTMKHYALGEKDRQNERLKKVANKFA